MLKHQAISIYSADEIFILLDQFQTKIFKIIIIWVSKTLFWKKGLSYLRVKTANSTPFLLLMTLPVTHISLVIHICISELGHHYTPAQRSWRGGILDSPCPSVCLSVRPSVCLSVCRRHGFRSISQVCFGISISNFICMLMVAIGRSLLIFSDVTFKMAAWRPYWIFWFPDSNFTLALNINFKFQRHNSYVYV